MNVWEVLGIAPTSDPATIKRAYAAQLKLHKPQVDPEGFQRLREAYTWALRWGDRFERDEWDDEENEQEAEPAEGAALAVRDDTLPPHSTEADGTALHAADVPAAADRPPEPELRPAMPLQAPSPATPAPATESAAAAEERLLAAFDALTHLDARNDVRIALHRWVSDPALEHFDVRRALSMPVFERTIAWLLENAKRRRALLAAPEFVQPLDQLFDWRSDELELEREFGDEVETVFVVLDPTRALQSERRPVRDSSWPATLKRAVAMIGLLVGLTMGINQWLRPADDRTPSSTGEPLSAAETAYHDGKYERAITLAEQARGADDFERGQLVVRALLALGRLDPARARAEALVAASPGLPDAQVLVADVYNRMGRCADANRHYDRAQAIEWAVDAGNNLAWGLATCPEPQARDGARAVTLAERVVREKPVAIYIDTLAAAYAERGDFDAAMREQRRALGAAHTEELDDDELQGMRARLLTYQQGRPYHRPPPAHAQAIR